MAWALIFSYNTQSAFLCLPLLYLPPSIYIMLALPKLALPKQSSVKQAKIYCIVS